MSSPFRNPHSLPAYVRRSNPYLPCVPVFASAPSHLLPVSSVHADGMRFPEQITSIWEGVSDFMGAKTVGADMVRWKGRLLVARVCKWGGGCA